MLGYNPKWVGISEEIIIKIKNSVKHLVDYVTLDEPKRHFGIGGLCVQTMRILRGRCPVVVMHDD